MIPDERLKEIINEFQKFGMAKAITSGIGIEPCQMAAELLTLRSQKAKVMTALKFYANIHRYSGTEKMAVELLKELEE
jgi:hypothetical protein